MKDIGNADEVAMKEKAPQQQPPTKRGRHIISVKKQKAWLENKAKAWGGPVPNVVIRRCLGEGIAAGILPETTNCRPGEMGVQGLLGTLNVVVVQWFG